MFWAQLSFCSSAESVVYELKNPKFEARNPKQIQSPNIPMTETVHVSPACN